MEQETLINKKNYNILVIGAGHVGLVTAACFAELGHKVICVDNDSKKIKLLNKLKIPFYEPKLDSLIIKNFKKRLFFSSCIEEGIKKSEIIFIAVGTPPLADGSADLTSIENIATTIASNLNSYKLVVEKSTVPVHTGKKIKETISRYKKNNLAFDVASNPEFLREGKAVDDFFNPDRIVIGVETKLAEKILKNIY
ncbi:MAG: nucleotide sugar dehydrogenase, partial [Candidatus Omnitrophica bacterium]|nr:nucleotide sugar dehydrogenase [Candidatus Omnitrophota bacterium]